MSQSKNDNKLLEYRNKIDKTDTEIVKLLIKRFNIANDVAEYKKANNLPVLHSGREDEVLKNIASQTDKENGDYTKYTTYLYKTIMEMSRLLQRFAGAESAENNSDGVWDFILNSCVNMKTSDDNNINNIIGCQGTEGAYSEKAANVLYKDNKKLFFENFSDVFDAVNNGVVDIGIIPLENSNAGSVKTIHGLLQKSDFYIAASVDLPVLHCLLAKKGADLSKITDIYSHEQAFLQCGNFFAENKHIKKHMYKNTAMAAKFVHDSDDNKIAAVGSEDCAELYNLEVIKRDLQDYKTNSTRFVCISKELKIFDDADKFTLVFKLKNKSGELNRLLTKFSVMNINLTKIESQPIAGSDFEFMFFADGEGNIKNTDILKLLRVIKSEVEYFKFLGNYKHYKR